MQNEKVSWVQKDNVSLEMHLQGAHHRWRVQSGERLHISHDQMKHYPLSPQCFRSKLNAQHLINHSESSALALQHAWITCPGPEILILLIPSPLESRCLWECNLPFEPQQLSLCCVP